MNGPFLHLAVNHIPVVGVPVAFLLLAYGMVRRSADVIRASLWLLVLMAIAALVAWKSGGPAARIVKDIPGIMRPNIHEHAEAADYAFWGALILGGLALVGLWLSRHGEGTPTALSALILLGSLFMSVVFARVAHLGGLIRHPEIKSGYPPAGQAAPLAPKVPVTQHKKKKP
jgi:uncharacterized membrane protein